MNRHFHAGRCPSQLTRSVSLPKQNRRLTATQRGARDGAIDVNSDALPAGSRLNEEPPNAPQSQHTFACCTSANKKPVQVGRDLNGSLLIKMVAVEP